MRKSPFDNRIRFLQLVVGLCSAISLFSLYMVMAHAFVSRPQATLQATPTPQATLQATPTDIPAGSRCVHGSLMLNVCFCDPGFVGGTCEEKDTEQPPPCSEANDLCFYSRQNGVCKVSEERWKRAQEAEARAWRGAGGGSDRSNDHLEGFKNYADVPEFLGNVLEIGCGPWTQLGFLLDQPRKWIVDNITLWEPGAKEYMTSTPGCAYKDGKLRGRAVTVVSLGAEHIEATEQYDTVMMINTLEHVQNMYIILENLHRALRPGGLLIFNDRWWDHYDWALPVNAGAGLDHLYHPIRCRRRVYEHFLSYFQPLYQVVNPNAVTKHGDYRASIS